jgi:hypothetical protein
MAAGHGGVVMGSAVTSPNGDDSVLVSCLVGVRLDSPYRQIYMTWLGKCSVDAELTFSPAIAVSEGFS